MSPLNPIRWQVGLTPDHWRYEVFIDGERATDAVSVRTDGSAVILRMGDAGYERDGLDRIKADLITGHRVELRRTNPDPLGRVGECRCKPRPEPLVIVICQTEEVLTIAA